MRLSWIRLPVIISVLVFCSLVNLSIGVTGENNLQYVLERFLKSSGGRAEFQKLRSIRIVGRIDFINGQSGSIVVLKKKPNMVRMTFDYGDYRVTQAYDGETAWWMQEHEAGNKIEHFKMQGQMEKSFIREAPIANALINRDIEGVDFILGPDERIAGNNCVRIDVTFPDGSQSIHYLSKETYHEVRIVKQDPQGVVENIIVPSRFEIIDGVVFSTRISQMDAAGVIISTMFIESIETNLGLLNSAFSPQVEFEDLP